MDIFLALFTYFAYIFIIVMYSIKAAKYLKMPMHLRWELFTSSEAIKSNHDVVSFGASERPLSHTNKEWSSKIWTFMREYLWFPSYLTHNKVYWLFLYIAHIGFAGLIIFQLLCITTALGTFIVDDHPLDSVGNDTSILAILRIILGTISFWTGMIGNIGLMIYRITNRDLRLYTPPLTFIGYLVSVGIGMIGFILLLTQDPYFSGYINFFIGMIRLQPTEVSGLLGLFILLNAFHLLYLPFTPGFHYISRAFAFFGIQWDTRPNVKGGKIEKAIGQAMKEKITWSAPHIKPGQTWEEAAKDRT
jgi:nitrate reductase gamma subunit